MKLRYLDIGMVALSLAVFGTGFYFLAIPQLEGGAPVVAVADAKFGWKFPPILAASPRVSPPVFGFIPSSRSPNLLDFEIAYSDIRDPGGIPEGLPVRLQIPAIGVDSAIEDALITPDGRMDVPQGSVNVAWFALGPNPGQEGSAVIGGHFGTRNGVPFVFYNLDKLRIGDRIFIVDDRDDTLAFVVRDIKLFERDADATTVFTSGDGLAHLNLITCEGIWNKVDDTYPQRRVVFTDAVLAGEPLAPTPAPTLAPTPRPVVAAPVPKTLIVGSRGPDVVALQNALITRGFLLMPVGIAKGYFGVLTRDALAKYQLSVGLPATGVLDPKTRAALFAVAGEPTLPSTAITSPPPAPTPSASATPSPTPSPTPIDSLLVQAAESLYATPVDGIITSLLLLAMSYVVVRIVRRA